MSQITLVRHGQANSAAKDEGGYDKLSPLGWQQAEWLGGHYRDTGEVFARVYSGTLRRHRETAQAIAPNCPTETVVDPRLNELEYFTMAQLLDTQHGIPLPDTREGFIRHMPQLFQHWQKGKLDGAPEAYDAFEARVRDVLAEITAGQGRALVVTSGGLIGMAMRVTLRLDMAALCHVCLAIQNTSVSSWLPLDGQLALTQFNATPHLDTPERLHAQTHI